MEKGARKVPVQDAVFRLRWLSRGIRAGLIARLGGVHVPGGTMTRGIGLSTIAP